MPQKRKLVLIDGHSLAYRAFHALPEDMSTSEGELTNAVFGFASMLLNVIRDEKPSHIAVTFDKGLTFRHDLYPEYKAHRAEMPDELRSQMERIRQVVETMQVPIFEQEGFEADDLLAICVQHELDHLEGKLFVDYLSPLKRKRIQDKLAKIKRFNEKQK